MTAEVHLHIPTRFLDNFQTREHLKLYGKIKSTIQGLGGQVRVIARDKRLCRAQNAESLGLVTDGNLHIVPNGHVQAENVLNSTIAYIKPFWILNQQGVLANSSIAGEIFDPGQIDGVQAGEFFAGIHHNLVGGRRSRYDQTRTVEEFPEDSIAVFLQGNLPQRKDSAYCSNEDMLRAVAKGANGRTVLVKAHPNATKFEDIQMLAGLMGEGLEFHPTDANVHDILKSCALSVSMNSAVSVEGFLHKKPAVLFGKSDFHHIVETVKSPNDFPAAMSRALSVPRDYEKFLFWYFHEHCLSFHDGEFVEKLLAQFADLGFDRERLGLRF